MRTALPRTGNMVAATLGLALTGCASDPLLEFSLEMPPTVLAPASAVGVVDGRARFREILCAVNDARGQAFPDYRPCEETLWRVAGEAEPSGEPVHLGKSDSGLRVLIVAGLGWECLESFLDPDFSSSTNLKAQGFETQLLPVAGLAGSPHNARMIREGILELEGDEGRNLILLGYSKGAPDILEAIGRHPEIQPRVAAMVSVSGAIGGSPLADDVTESTLDFLTKFPGATCEPGDGMAIDSLRQTTRLRWLAEHPLPEEIASFSVVSFTNRENVSRVLRSSYDEVSQVDPRNDSQLIFYNQIIPGSDLLGYLNADHWAMAVPITRTHDGIVASLANKNAFPREVALEAVLRYVDESLSAP